MTAGPAATETSRAGPAYALLAYQVSRQSREIGVRLAVGASARRVAGTVLGGGLRLVAAGTAVGLPLAWLCALGIRSLLHGVDTLDPATARASAAVAGSGCGAAKV